MKATISTRQTAIISSLLIFANKLLVLPSLLYERSKADGFFAVLILLALEMLLLYMFLKVKNAYPNLSFYELIKQKLGVVFAKFFYVLLIVYFFFKVMLLFNVTFMYLHIQVYLDATYYLFMFAFLFVMTTSALRGLRPLARGAEFVFSFIVASLLFCLFLSFFNFRSFPIFFEQKFGNVLNSSWHTACCCGDVLVLFVIMDKIELRKGFNKKVLIYSGLSCLLVLLVFFMFYSIFGVTSFVHNNALSDIITFSYRFLDLGRLDLVAIIVNMFLSFLQLSIYAYMLMVCFKQIFPKITDVYIVTFYNLVFIVIMISAAINYVTVIYLAENVFSLAAPFIHFIVPAILFVCALRKSKRKEEA